MTLGPNRTYRDRGNSNDHPSHCYCWRYIGRGTWCGNQWGLVLIYTSQTGSPAMTIYHNYADPVRLCHLQRRPKWNIPGCIYPIIRTYKLAVFQYVESVLEMAEIEEIYLLKHEDIPRIQSEKIQIQGRHGNLASPFPCVVAVAMVTRQFAWQPQHWGLLRRDGWLGTRVVGCKFWATFQRSGWRYPLDRHRYVTVQCRISGLT